MHNDFLHQIPIRNIEWEINPETDFVVLKKPKFQHPWLKKYLLPKLKNQYYRIKLDKIGTFVWQKIDGKHNVDYIAKALESHFGDEVRPVNERLAKFIFSLHRSQFIKFSQK